MSETVKIVSFLEERCSFTWSIEKFSSCTEYLMSPKFTTGQSSSPSWCIRLHPNHTREETEKDYVVVYLQQRMATEEKSIDHAIFMISIIDSSNKERYIRSVELNLFTELSDARIDLISRDYLFGENRSLLLPNDTLTLLLELNVKVHVKSSGVIQQPIFKDSGAPIGAQLPFSSIGSLLRLYDNEMFSDFTIKVGDEELKVHKLILSACSTVFETMLSCDMKENITNCMEIDDFEPQVVKTMLRYIYSGQVGPLMPDKLFQLYSIADKYNLLGLKNTCVRFLLRNLNVDNICDVLVLAEMHNETELMTAVKKMFCENAAAIQNTEQWFNLCKTNPDLTTSMYRHVISNIAMDAIAIPNSAKRSKRH